MAEAGEFDGATLGVYGSQIEEAQVNDEILPLLDELGVEVTETVITDVTATADITQSNAAVQTAAERFTASGVDTVLVVGDAGLGWANGVEPTDFRPRLLLTSPNSVQAWARDPAGHDLSVLEDAAAGNVYGPNQKVWELPQMQECIQIVEDAGVPVPEPDSVPEDGARCTSPGWTPAETCACSRRWWRPPARTSTTARWRRRPMASRSSSPTSPSPSPTGRPRMPTATCPPTCTTGIPMPSTGRCGTEPSDLPAFAPRRIGHA